MFYVFDTNICRLAIEKHPSVIRNIERLSAGDRVCSTLISFGESVGGWLPLCRRADNGEERAHYYGLLYAVFNFYRGMVCLPFDDGAAVIFNQLRAQKVRVKTNDLSIAAITLSVNGILVTRNTVDFERVPGLVFEDWAK